jgi:hypothetical protein
MAEGGEGVGVGVGGWFVRDLFNYPVSLLALNCHGVEGSELHGASIGVFVPLHLDCPVGSRLLTSV